MIYNVSELTLVEWVFISLISFLLSLKIFGFIEEIDNTFVLMSIAVLIIFNHRILIIEADSINGIESVEEIEDDE